MKKQQKTFLIWLSIILFSIFFIKSIDQTEFQAKELTFSQLASALEKDQIKDVTLKGKTTLKGQFKEGYDQGSFFKVTVNTDHALKYLENAHIIPNYEKEDQNGGITGMIFNWLPMVFLLGMLFLFFKQIQAGGGKAFTFGKVKTKSSQDKTGITFKDVAGVDEAKEELEEIVDFLKNPKKYTALGGKIPKGVLLVGPPGTGKTLLAKAVSGEANVPFFSISGSDFVEMFVGVGASRVRDLFEQAKKQSPCIIFIDEIDAVGRHRGTGLGGGHDEREQTLNQLLVEMDGFEDNKSGTIVIAATNRADVLDPALLRPGRFDRRVMVNRPDIKGRLEILKVHTRKTPLEEKINLEILARGTPGFTGADLANMINEGALIAARNNKKKISLHDLEEAKDKVLMGSPRKSLVISDLEKKITAYHEAGHTIVGFNLDQVDPIHKVTIIPRGMALGVTQTLPLEDRLNMTKEKAKNYISFLMGGRAAEEIIFNEMTSGASNDIERATELAKNMVCDWGMSSLGPIHFGSARNKSQPFLGASLSDQNHISESTATLIDKEIHLFIEAGYKKAVEILEKNKDLLVQFSEKLIEKETLNAEEIHAILSS
jgi:cell division protease FtsH